MIIYNITFKIDHRIFEEWFEKIQLDLLPKIKSENSVIEIHFLRLLMADDNGVTYCLQHTFSGLVDCEVYENDFINPYLINLYSLFQDKVLHFSTKLEVVD